MNDACNTTLPHQYAPLNPTTIYCQACGTMRSSKPEYSDTDSLHTPGERPEWVAIEEQYYVTIGVGESNTSTMAFDTFADAKQQFREHQEYAVRLSCTSTIFEMPSNVKKYEKN